MDDDIPPVPFTSSLVAPSVVSQPPEKRSKNVFSEETEEHNDLEAPEEREQTTDSIVERLTSVLSSFFLRDESNYGSWDGLYKCIQREKLDPTLTVENCYPSSDKPVLIPLIYPPSFDVVRLVKPKGMKLDSDWPEGKPIPVVSSEVIVKFLSLVHLSTVVKLKSHAVVYSHSRGDLRFFGVLPQTDNSVYLPEINKTEQERSLFEVFSQKESCSKKDAKYFMRCWIVTHPTSDVFLSNDEILQLYKNTCVNRDSFCIVISPWSAGMKMLCVQLTDDGFTKIEELESSVSQNPSLSGSAGRVILESLIGKYKHSFYQQIPCLLSEEPCIYHDLRDIRSTLSKVRDLVLNGVVELKC